MSQRYRDRAGGRAAQNVLLIGLVALVLAPTLLGRVGYMAIEEVVAARIFPLHQHGVPGEAEYIRTFGAPAPFIHLHCHPDSEPPRAETPTQLALGGLLFGPLRCGSDASLPPAPLAVLAVVEHPTGTYVERVHAPPVPPPQA